MRYIRKGECKRCGVCCLAEDCEHLQFNNGVATCLIFNSPDRPAKCGNFPAAPPVMIEKCGFYFIDTQEDDRIIRSREI